ncbi:MAG: ATP-binding cassette domain-containing protein [Lachnospiraceae bacterium]|nr:ATP-binding cassette domain-containing protein [Lachnospiraceae bacterium]
MIGYHIRERMAGRWFRVAIIPEKTAGAVTFSHVDFAYEKKNDIGKNKGPAQKNNDKAGNAAVQKNNGKPENITAQRDSDDGLILRDVSFSLEPGRSIAIVGPSGAGKSTIVSLIPRLYDVLGGSVSVDGVDVRQLDLSWLRANIGIVTQDTYLFNGSLRENLLYAKPNASEEELIEVCKKANIYDMIRALPEGFDTLVGNRGLKLSGGERQRISIARVLLKDPALLIFDEATSALDSISEASIQKAIDPLIRTRTSILIAHRLSTILAADKILVVRDGRIVEEGTHAGLLQTGGVYSELYRTQYGKELAA